MDPPPPTLIVACKNRSENQEMNSGIEVKLGASPKNF